MEDTNTERQRRYLDRMYKAGLKKKCVWVKRKEPRQQEMSINEFVRRLKISTKGWDNDSLSELFNLFIKIIQGKKEEEKVKKKL